MLTKVNNFVSDVQELRILANQSPRFSSLAPLERYRIARRLSDNFRAISFFTLDIKLCHEALRVVDPPIIRGRISTTALVPIQQALTSQFQTKLASALAKTAHCSTVNI